MTGTAYFVRRPRTIADLQVPFPRELERLYEIVKTIHLRAIDYENFTTDLLADRAFIEGNAHLCEQSSIWKSLLVHQRGLTDGILVMPENSCFVGWAGYKSCFSKEVEV